MKWQTIILSVLSQAQLTYLVVDSSLSHKLQSKLRLPALLTELIRCPVCTGFWLALGFSFWVGTSLADRVLGTLAVGFLGSVAYELKAKYAPCKACQNSVDVSKWKVN